MGTITRHATRLASLSLNILHNPFPDFSFSLIFLWKLNQGFTNRGPCSPCCPLLSAAPSPEAVAHSLPKENEILVCIYLARPLINTRAILVVVATICVFFSESSGLNLKI